MTEAWRRTSLGEAARITIGRTPPRNEPRYWTDDLSRPFCTIADMSGRLVDPRREGVTDAAESEGKAKRVPAGALLMSFKLTIGRVGFAARDLFPNEAIARLESTDPDLDERFLALWLEAQDLSQGSGRAVKGSTLNSESLRSIRVEVPPLPVQRRIVDLVGALDAHIANLQIEADAARLSLDRLADVLWEQTDRMNRIGDLGAVVTGSTPKTSVLEYWRPSEIPFLTPGDLDRLTVVSDWSRFVSSTGAQAGRIVPRFSVAVVCIGATIGKIGLTTTPLVTNQQINSVTGLGEQEATLLALLLGSTKGQSSMASRAGQTAVPILNKSQFQSIEIPWDPEAMLHLADAGRGILTHHMALETEGRTLARLRARLLDALLSREVEIPESYDALLAGVA